MRWTKDDGLSHGLSWDHYIFERWNRTNHFTANSPQHLVGDGFQLPTRWALVTFTSEVQRHGRLLRKKSLTGPQGNGNGLQIKCNDLGCSLDVSLWHSLD